MCGVLAMQIHIHLTLVEKHMQIKVMQHFYPTYLLAPLPLSLPSFLPSPPLSFPPDLCCGGWHGQEEAGASAESAALHCGRDCGQDRDAHGRGQCQLIADSA